ncbi:MAG: hypothetical protein KC422_25370 [Trueperaceae bacterium]|nr:hypothetical protein [Trueperaceae bacterium]
MVRKQLYIEEQQERALKNKAKALGISEAELVRQALNTVLKEEAQTRPAEKSLLDTLFAEADQIAKDYQFGEKDSFDRQSLYEDDKRQNRF